VNDRPGEIYAGKLPLDIDENDLRDLFAVFGEVARVVLVRDAAGCSRGFGFVTMASPESVLPAVDALDGTALRGHVIRVNVARDKGAPAPRRRY
jgi:RNA recognition motif-containing protein